jgi:hypothetical protein
MEMQARDQYNSFDVTMCFRYLKYEDLEWSILEYIIDKDFT